MTSNDILIRKATKEDYAALMDLYNQFVGEDRYSKHTGDSFYAVLTNSANRIFIAVQENDLIGLATVSFRRVVRYSQPIAELDELYVKDEFRKKGVGKLLMNAVINESKKRKCCRIYIESGYKWTIAHAFYKSIGFTDNGLHFLMKL